MSDTADLDRPAEAPAALGVIDCDLHQFPIDGESIMRNLPKPWQERFRRKGSFLNNTGAPTRYTKRA
jgi:hypothetical protein